MEIDVASLLPSDAERLFNELEGAAGEERASIARRLRVVIEPETARAWLQRPEVKTDADLQQRILWALGETHSPAAGQIIRDYVDARDPNLAGVALTGIVKTDPDLGEGVLRGWDQTRSKRIGRRASDARRIIEQRKRVGVCVGTLVKVENARAVDAIWDEFLSDAYATGEFDGYTAHRRMVGAMAGEFAGLWIDYFLPIALGVAANRLDKGLCKVLEKLRKKRERPVITLEAALHVARAEAAGEDDAEKLRLVRAIELSESIKTADRPEGVLFLSPDEYHPDEAFLIEFQVRQERIVAVVSSDGRITQMIRRRAPKTKSKRWSS